MVWMEMRERENDEVRILWPILRRWRGRCDSKAVLDGKSRMGRLIGSTGRRGGVCVCVCMCICGLGGRRREKKKGGGGWERERYSRKIQRVGAARFSSNRFFESP